MTLRHALVLATALPAIALLGCSNREERKNEGSVCLFANAELAAEHWNSQDAPQPFAEGAPVFFVFKTKECLSSSCDTEREVRCSVQRDGDVLTVETEASWVRRTIGGCTEDCGILSTTCQSPALAAGTYTVKHGADSVTFTVPSEPTAPPCTAAPLF